MLWSRGVARASIIGPERTHNPSPAAAHLLGRALGSRRVRRTAKRLSRVRRSAHRGNPLPALVAAAAPLLGGLGKKFQSREAKDAARFATADGLAQRAMLGDKAALVELQRVAGAFATQRAKDYAAGKLAEVTHALLQAREASAAGSRREAAASRREQQAITTQRLGLVTGAAGQVGAALLRGGRRPRQTRRRRSYRY